MSSFEPPVADVAEVALRHLSDARDDLCTAHGALGRREIAVARESLASADEWLSLAAYTLHYVDPKFWQDMYEAAALERDDEGLKRAAELLLRGLLVLVASVDADHDLLRCTTDGCDQRGEYASLEAFGLLCQEHHDDSLTGDRE